MKEDVLEQIVEDYLQHQGYFTTHNVRFRPSSKHPDYVIAQDAVHSDIDIIGYRPTATNPMERVIAVSCKSWQSGFDARQKLGRLRGELKDAKRPTWMHLRELWVPKWSQAFRGEVRRLTGQSEFTYALAVTRLTGAWGEEQANHEWTSDPTIKKRLGGRPFRFLTLREMWESVLAETTQTTAPSEIGRVIQLLVAAQLIDKPTAVKPNGPK